MTKKQQVLLESIPVKKHDPDGVTVKMVMKRTGWRDPHAARFIRLKIESGEAVACWVKEGGRFVRAMKLK